MGGSRRQQDRVEGEDKLRLWSLFKGSYYQTRGANESSCGDGSWSLRKREKGQRSAASMITPLTHIPGSNMRRAAVEGTRNTKRDVQGSNHGVGAVRCSLLPMESCKPLRASPVFNLMLVHVVSQRS